MSEKTPSRMDIARGAAISVLDTLGVSDYVSIVRFSD